ncbi:MAG: hypothetical protein ACOYNI_03190 [Acidimicrobiia bacterium]
MQFRFTRLGAAVGQTLTTSDGSWSAPAAFTYEWSRCKASCVAIPLATTATYTAVFADIGFTLSATVRATNVAGSATADSAATTRIPVVRPVAVNLPSITGTAKVGTRLFGGRGVWTGGAIAYSRKWERCLANGTGCVAIDGATYRSYRLTNADVGKRVRFVVTASNTAGVRTSRSVQTRRVAL